MVVAVIGGCQIRVHWLFVVVLLLAALSGYLGVFLLSFALVLLHEGSHAVVANAYGFRAREIELLPFGGVARIDGLYDANPDAELAIAAAGPACNLVLAMTALSLDRFLPLPPERVRLFVDVNLGMAALNLLPVLPLDGGRMVRGLLARRFDVIRVTRLAAAFGMAAAGVLALLFLWMALHGTLNLSVLLMAIFLLLAAWREYRMAPTLLYRGLAGQRGRLSDRSALPVRQLVVRQDMTLAALAHRLTPGFYHIVTVVDDDCRPLGILHEEMLVDGILRHGASTLVAGLLTVRPTPFASH